jgi:WhiB family transcriptional regulator, redox-sensing transcriptional regulator
MRVSTSWRDHAACRDADPDIFFPIGESGPALDQIDEAKRICRTCPAQAPCLTWALEHQITDGIWGSNTPEERYVIRKIPRQMKTCPLYGGVDMAVAAAALGHLLGLEHEYARATELLEAASASLRRSWTVG